MSTPRIAVAFAAAFFASIASVWPTPHLPGSRGAAEPGRESGSLLAGGGTAEGRGSPFRGGGAESREVERAWPPPGLTAASASSGAGAGVTARLELTASGAHRLVVEKAGTFVHLRYREVTSAGPDWASIEMRAGTRAPADDVAVWEHTDPQTLVTARGTVRFSLKAGGGAGAEPEVVAAVSPKAATRSDSAVRTCQSFEDGDSGFAVVCKVAPSTSSVRAIRPVSPRPLAGAWVWEEPVVFVTPKPAPPPSGPFQIAVKRAPDPKPVRVASKPPLLGSRFVRIDLPLSVGAADVGAFSFTHGGKGFVVRAEAQWPSAGEAPTLLISETSRVQPQGSSSFWQ